MSLCCVFQVSVAFTCKTEIPFSFLHHFLKRNKWKKTEPAILLTAIKWTILDHHNFFESLFATVNSVQLQDY